MRKWFLWAAAGLWMALIFSFLAQTAAESKQASGEVIVWIARAVLPGFDELPKSRQDAIAEDYQNVMRKTAHAALYAALGALLLAALFQHALRQGRRAPLAFGIAALYAATDELHQLFVDGRGAQVKDILLDSGGALLGILIVFAIRGIRRKRRAAAAGKEE